MITRRIVAAASTALAVLVAAVLGLDAAATAWFDIGAAVLIALAAVFVVQPLYVLARKGRRQ